MIPTDLNFQEFRESNDILGDPVALQQGLAEDGYLFFRRLQDPEMLRELRRQMLTTMQHGGWIKQGTDPMDGIAEPGVQCTEGDLAYTDVYHEVYRNQLFHESAHRSEMIDTVSAITGCPMMPQPQKVARLWFPRYTAHTTPIHQDFVHFQGSFNNLTCWAPVGDCPIELGGLAVLKGSHQVDHVMQHHFSLGAGSLMINPENYEPLGLEWHTTNYGIGDTLIFPALTLHMALPNITEDRLRVSLDNRYQAVDETIAEHMLEPHLSNFSHFDWPDVYRDWTSETYQYYWKQYNLSTVPRDTSYSDHGFDQACELARQGNDEAIHHLQRFVKRAAGTPEAAEAQAVLDQLT